MHNNQAQFKNHITLIAVIFAGIAFAYTFNALHYPEIDIADEPTPLTLAGMAGIGSFFGAWSGLKLCFRKPVNMQRGAKFGLLGGIFAVYFTGLLLSIWWMMDGPPHPDATTAGRVTAAMLTPIFAVFMSVIVFICGGYLAPILGVLTGLFIGRKIENGNAL